MDRSIYNKGFLIILFLCGSAFGTLGDVEVTGDLYLKGDEKKVYWYNGDYYLTLRAPSILASNYNYVWMSDYGDSGQAITGDGAGGLSWSTPAGAGDMLKATYDPGDDGLIDPNAGGLGLDVSGLTGLLAISGGSCAEIDASAELLALMDDETGTGALVFATSPTLVTPTLGAATATTLIIADANTIGSVTTPGAMTILADGKIGIGPVAITPAYSFSVGSTDGSCQVGIGHNNLSAQFWTTDGYFEFRSDKGDNSNAVLDVHGKGTGFGFIRVFDGAFRRMNVGIFDGYGRIHADAGASGLQLQYDGLIPVKMFSGSTEGKIPAFEQSGFRAGDVLRTFATTVGKDANDTVSFDGVSNYYFDGNIEGATITEGGVAVYNNDEMDTKSELEAILTDVTALITDDDIPAAAADPDIDAAGEIGRDTDGANETGDSSLRGHDGAAQFLYARKIKTISFTLIEPDQIDAADLIPVWHNTSGMTFTILEWKAWSDDDNVSLEIEELTDQTDYTAITTVDAVEIATDGTGVFYASDTTITHAAIEHDHSIAIDFDTSDTPDYVQITITGWFNADVD